MGDIQAIRGMHDIIPGEIRSWQVVEAQIRDLVASYGYDEIRFPILEPTDLFARTLGVSTDIVEKEMYTFEDRNGDSLSLRPEGTAGCTRACIQSGLLHNQMQRLWYMGPMYRHERPQKGRTRQFHQFGVEVFGMPGPDADAEIILMTAQLFKQLGILKVVRLEINSLGLPQERAAYRQHLVDYFKKHLDQLDPESLRRLDSNPMRLLDTKNPDMKTLVSHAPILKDHLGEVSKAHFATLCQLLDTAGVVYTVNDRLVRGLDYYTHTVFEWITDSLGAQGTICGGGRYDGLVEMLGGKPTPGVGFGLGLERLIEVTAAQQTIPALLPHLCVLPLGDQATAMALSVADTLRKDLPGLRVQTLLGGGSVKSLFKRADKSGADLALIIGDEEIERKTVTLKALRDTMEQSQWHLNDELLQFLAQQFNLTLNIGNNEATRERTANR